MKSLKVKPFGFGSWGGVTLPLIFRPFTSVHDSSQQSTQPKKSWSSLASSNARIARGFLSGQFLARWPFLPHS